MNNPISTALLAISIVLMMNGCEVSVDTDEQISDEAEQNTSDETENTETPTETEETEETTPETPVIDDPEETEEEGSEEETSTEPEVEEPVETENPEEPVEEPIEETVLDSEILWQLNTDERSDWIYESSVNQGVAEGVQAVSTTTVSGAAYWSVSATGIPKYDIQMTSEIISELNTRPKASTDFVAGMTSANIGDMVTFGADIGYNSSSENCFSTGGAGYWPPGPGCPQDVAKTGLFPQEPEPASKTCYSGLGAMGYAVNGASFYNWSDGQSYQNQGVWHNLAAEAERYDVDICGGHAANSDYHHHFYSPCLAESMDDTGSTHSPVYGIAADGYPIHGPWHANGVLVKSSWVARDYDDANSPTGCGGGGNRTCVLVDQLDASQGTTNASSNGPNTSSSFNSMSGNVISAISGVFLQDFYFDSSLSQSSDIQLDKHNGHAHDGLSYHYHFTITMDNANSWSPTFPYIVGPEFYGELHSNSVTQCGTSMTPQTGGMPPRR